MDLNALLALAPFAAIVVLVNLGGFVAKLVWNLPALGAFGRFMARTMPLHPPLVGAGLACIPGLLSLPLVQEAAVGLVLGELASDLYDRIRAWAKGRRAEVLD